MLDAARMVRLRLGHNLTAEQFRRETGYSARRMMNLWGSWTALQEAAEIVRERRRRISDAELLEAIGRVWREIGRAPSWNDLERLTGYCGTTYARRFGGKRQMVAAYQRHASRQRESGAPEHGPQAAAAERVRDAAWVRSMWERLTVAYVVSSSEMRERPHGLCDLVVCLRHDWKGGAVRGVVMGEAAGRH